MVLDYGSPGRPRWRKGQRVAFAMMVAGHAVGLVVFAVLAVLPTLLTNGPGDGPDAEDPARVLRGSPCRAITRAEFERGWTAPPRSFAFDGVTFARRRGDASCVTRSRGTALIPVCQFSVPIAVAVSGPRGEAWFDVGVGKAAAVEVAPAGPRCVVTGRAQLWS
jgi:hypothetical protein